MTEYARRPLFRRGGGRSSTYWRGLKDVPATVIQTEDSYPLATEAGEYLVTE